jgi:hypothetical protein
MLVAGQPKLGKEGEAIEHKAWISPLALFQQSLSLLLRCNPGLKIAVYSILINYGDQIKDTISGTSITHNGNLWFSSI